MATIHAGAVAAQHRMLGPDAQAGNMQSCEMNGPISKADVEPLKRSISAGCFVLVISSEGGDVDAALTLGRILRAGTVSVAVKEGGRCASSCVFIFAAGVERIPRGMVQIHRPYSLSTAKSLHETEVSFERVGAEVRAYLKKMNVSERLYQMMVEIPPQELRTLNLEEMDELGLRFRDPVWQEHLDNRTAQTLRLSKQKLLTEKARAKSLCGDIDAVLPKETSAQIVSCWRREFPGFLPTASE